MGINRYERKTVYDSPSVQCELQILFAQDEPMSLRRKESVSPEEASGNVFYVASGLIFEQTFYESLPNRGHIHHVAKEGQVVGLQSFAAGKTSYRIVAAEASTIVPIKIDVLEEKMQQHPALALLFIELTKQAIDEQYMRAVAKRKGGISAVSHALLTFKRDNEICVFQETIARYAMITRELVNKQLGILEKRGTIRRDGPIEIISAKDLSAIAEGDMYSGKYGDQTEGEE